MVPACQNQIDGLVLQWEEIFFLGVLKPPNHHTDWDDQCPDVCDVVGCSPVKKDSQSKNIKADMFEISYRMLQVLTVLTVFITLLLFPKM